MGLSKDKSNQIECTNYYKVKVGANTHTVCKLLW